MLLEGHWAGAAPRIAAKFALLDAEVVGIQNTCDKPPLVLREDERVSDEAFELLWKLIHEFTCFV